MKKLVKRLAARFGIEVRRVLPDPLFETVSLAPPHSGKGDILLSYRTKPFLSTGAEDMNSHYCNWQCAQMAEAFLDLGYRVDVIHWLNDRFVPEKEYAVFIDVHANIERLGSRLGKDCLKVLHIIWAHWLFHNSAEYGRCLALQRRRGISLRPRRQLAPARGIEHADTATVTGNSFTMETYSYAGKPAVQVPISAQAVYPWQEEKDFGGCRRSFLWLGGGGLVHKGLDLVLEAFSGLPDFHLYVCGPIHTESDFEAAFRDELYGMQNIHTIGWMDVCSPAFADIAKRCAGLIYPSCSESGAGTVINSMHAGLIPLISRESGVDVGDAGLILRDCSVESIRDAVVSLSERPAGELREMARAAWESVRARHTKEAFAREYRAIAERLVNRRP